MSDPRGLPDLGAHPWARFRCLVCRRFVTATERGVCPGCGRAPPVVVETSGRDERAWARAGRRRRVGRSAASRGIGPAMVAVVALAVAALAVAWAVGL